MDSDRGLASLCMRHASKTVPFADLAINSLTCPGRPPSPRPRPHRMLQGSHPDVQIVQRSMRRAAKPIDNRALRLPDIPELYPDQIPDESVVRAITSRTFRSVMPEHGVDADSHRARAHALQACSSSRTHASWISAS